MRLTHDSFARHGALNIFSKQEHSGVPNNFGRFEAEIFLNSRSLINKPKPSLADEDMEVTGMCLDLVSACGIEISGLSNREKGY